MNGFEHLPLFVFGARDSALGCRVCRGPVALGDAFGHSERVCAACRGQVTPMPKRRVRDLLRRLAA